MVGAARGRAVELSATVDVEDQLAVGEFQDSVYGFGNACARVLADNYAVHDDEEFFGNDSLFVFGEVGQ